MEQLDVVVIGAGVVGLAVARALGLAGREVVVLEAESAIGSHASSRNSEVIHAGIYYTPGSLKARACVAGRELLYAYCRERGIAHRRIGKLLVAVEPAEIATLNVWCARARRNGVDDMRLLDRAEWREMEPEIDIVAAALSPSTGIVDSHALMLSLRADVERAGGIVVCNSPVEGGGCAAGLPWLRVGGLADATVSCRLVVNCAGLRATAVARALGVPHTQVPGALFARGRYFALAGAAPFRRLIYPLPGAGGLGVHVTLDLGGQARFGPDVQWIDDVDYRFEEGGEDACLAAVARYFPGIAQRRVHPAYCGIRARIAGPQAEADFVVAGPREHGIDGVVNLFGIESPGLTAALALGAVVAQLAGG